MLFAGLGTFAAGIFGCASLRPVPRVDRPSPAVQRIAESIKRSNTGERERAIAAFHYVRDNVRFGFTGEFDGASPAYTLEVARGHCNPQATLFASLLRALGIEAAQHFVTIDGTILAGLFSAPNRISHSYVDVVLEGRSMKVDGYILDPEYLERARELLGGREREMGFGAHADGCVEWDGRSDCMSQLVSTSMVREDHGAFVDPQRFYESADYKQRLSGISLTMYRTFVVSSANRTLQRVREGELR